MLVAVLFLEFPQETSPTNKHFLRNQPSSATNNELILSSCLKRTCTEEDLLPLVPLVRSPNAKALRTLREDFIMFS